jgi:hypothetical protein
VDYCINIALPSFGTFVPLHDAFLSSPESQLPTREEGAYPREPIANRSRKSAPIDSSQLPDPNPEPRHEITPPQVLRDAVWEGAETESGDDVGDGGVPGDGGVDAAGAEGHHADSRPVPQRRPAGPLPRVGLPHPGIHQPGRLHLPLPLPPGAPGHLLRRGAPRLAGPQRAHQALRRAVPPGLLRAT